MLYQRLCKLLLVSLLFLGLGQSVFADEEILKTQYSKQDILSDFEELYQRLQSAHFDLYAHQSKKNFDEYYLELKSSIKKPLNLTEATLLFQRLTAYANIAHTKIDLPMKGYVKFRQTGGKTFPLYIKVIEGKVIVSENYSGNENIKVGDEIVSINEMPIVNLLNGLRKYKSADNDRMFHGFLEFELPMLLWFEYGAQENYQLEVRRDSGSKVITVNGVSHSEILQSLEKQTDLLELNFDRITKVYGNVGYLRTGPFFVTTPNPKDVYDNTEFKQFIDDAFITFAEKDVDALLIDLRVNPGGDNSFSDYLIKKFAVKDFKFASRFKVKVSEEFIEANEARLKLKPNSEISKNYKTAYQKLRKGEQFDFPLTINKVSEPVFKKPVYILVNRHSYSNAVTTAALVQDYGFATILGEETNDLATTYGAMESFNLSKTNINVSFPKAHIIRPNGNTEPRGVVPDIAIDIPLVEYSDDRVLKDALKIINKKL